MGLVMSLGLVKGVPAAAIDSVLDDCTVFDVVVLDGKVCDSGQVSELYPRAVCSLDALCVCAISA